jgi:hypothetical protein
MSYACMIRITICDDAISADGPYELTKSGRITDVIRGISGIAFIPLRKEYT